MTKTTATVTMLVVTFVTGACADTNGLSRQVSAGEPAAVSNVPPAAATENYPVLPKPGKKVSLGAGHYFIYGFDKQPKLGLCIMRVEVFTNEGKQDTSFDVTGEAAMPSMRGAHDSGKQPFALSRKGVYLLPVRVVMPGDWEIRFTFAREGNTVLRGAYLFDI